MENSLYGWVFIQGIDGIWNAARREYYFELFNGDKGNILKSEHIEDLIALISKGKGDKDKISKLLNTK